MTRKLQLNPCRADVKEAVFWRNAATVSMTGSRVMQIQLVRAGPSALGKLSTCFLSTARRGPPISALCPWAQSIQRLLRRRGFELCFQESKAYRQGVRCGRGKGVSVGFPGTGTLDPLSGEWGRNRGGFRMEGRGKPRLSGRASALGISYSPTGDRYVIALSRGVQMETRTRFLLWRSSGLYWISLSIFFRKSQKFILLREMFQCFQCWLTSVCMHAQAHAHPCTHAQRHACTHAGMHTHMHAHMHKCACTRHTVPDRKLPWVPWQPAVLEPLHSGGVRVHPAE